MSFIAWFGSISRTFLIASTTSLTRASRPLILASVLAIASAGFASAASAASARDAWITTQVKMALMVADDVNASAVSVDTPEGRVTLYGTVASAGERARTERAARSVDGVRELRDLLQVVEKIRQEAAAVADAALSKTVEQPLDTDPGLRDSKIRVKSVNRGLVLLDGKAKPLSASLRALGVPRSIPGVKKSRARSRVRTPWPTTRSGATRGPIRSLRSRHRQRSPGSPRTRSSGSSRIRRHLRATSTSTRREAS